MNFEAKPNELFLSDSCKQTEMENDEANGTNTVQQFLDAEFGFNSDIHMCGVCKLVFADINLFVEHKKQPCGGFFIASVKSLHPRGCGSSAPLDNAGSSSYEIPGASNVQETSSLVAAKESLEELSQNDVSSSKCTEAEELSPSLMEVNELPDAVSAPCVELEVNSENNIQNAIPIENPLDEQLSSNLTTARCVTTATTRADGKPRKAASKVGKLKKYTCDHPGCGYACAYPKDLMRHLRIHSGEQPFECSICNKKFNRSDKLRLHMRSHTGEKPYHCEVCNYSTSDHSSLNKHLRIHTGEKPYKCQICPYASRNSSQLVVHLRTHTLDAPYSCKICQRTFKISTDLKRHEHLHTGEKPFKCDACDYKCAFKGNLKMHFRLMHSTENNQSCSQCDFTTPSRKAFRQHLKSHEPNDISCPYPGCSFAAKSLLPLSIHVFTSHKDEPFKCVYCMYSPKVQGSVCKHVKRYYPSNSTPVANDTTNGNPGTSAAVEHVVMAADDSKICSKVKKINQATPHTSQEGAVCSNPRKLCAPKKRLSKNLKKAIVCKPLCVPHFGCHLCPAAFVREDSLRSHVRQHLSRNDTLVNNPKIAAEKPTEPDSSKDTDTLGSAYSATCEQSPILEMDGFQPVLEAISDAKEQVIEQALWQSGIICLEQIHSDNRCVEANETGRNFKVNSNGDTEVQVTGNGQSQVLATITTLGSTVPVQTGVQEGDLDAVMPLQSVCSTGQSEPGPLVYEVQHCYLVPFDSSVADTTQYIVQSSPGGFVQIMNSTSNAEKALSDKELNGTKCVKSKTSSQINNKKRPIMPKPQADLQNLTFDMP